ncbi:MAG: hypothetical protein M3436_12750 [Pseudomonadota bacterium]|nr:hypothetical protein [Pseudomonadota bacterium]
MEREECLDSNGDRLWGTPTLPEVGTSFPACLLIGGGCPRREMADLDLAHNGGVGRVLGSLTAPGSLTSSPMRVMSCTGCDVFRNWTTGESASLAKVKGP